MKIFGIFVLLIGIFFKGNAQPVLTAANSNYSVGNVNTLIIGNYIPPGYSGANQVWDLSSMSIYNYLPVEIKNASDTPYDSIYPLSNIAYVGSAYAYLYNDNQVQQLYGVYNSIIYTDPQDYFRYPFAFGDSYIDSFAGSYYDSWNWIEYSRTGTLEVHYDGYGTLILPNGIYPNVARIKFVEITKDISIFVPDTIQTYFEGYYWHLPGIPFPIGATYMTNNLIGSGFYLQNMIIGNVENELNSFNVLLVPNPADDNLNINNIPFETFEITIYDLKGQIIVRKEYNQHNSIISSFPLDISSLFQGIYILKIVNSDQIITCKFIKR